MSSFPSLFPCQAVQALDSEWRLLRNSDILCTTSDASVTEFWVSAKRKTRRWKSSVSTFSFLHAKVALFASLKCYVESVERTFSAINRMKTTLRNRLSTKIITGLLHTKRLVSNANCHSFKITEGLRQGLNSDMCKKSCIDHKGTEDDDASDED